MLVGMAFFFTRGTLTLSNMGKIISKNAVSFACCCCLDEATVLMLRVEGDLFGSGGNGLETTGCWIMLLRLLDLG